MKKSAIFFFSLISGSLFAQSYYYNSDGEKVEANIKEYGLYNFKVDDGTKKGVTFKMDAVSNFVMEGDSVTLLTDVNIPMGPKKFYVKVVVAGKISFYTNSYLRQDMDVHYIYLLRKGNEYESIDSFNKKWKDFFKDNSSIYNKVNALKAKDYYYDNTALLELIREYNEEEK